MITVNSTGLIQREQFASDANWTDGASHFAPSSGEEVRSGGSSWTNVGAGATGGGSMYFSPTLPARYGLAYQANVKIVAAGNFAGIGIFGQAGQNSSFYLGFSTINHMELTRYVGGAASNQDFDSTLTGVAGTWYTVRMTVKQNASNVDLRGLAFKGLSNGQDLTRSLTQYVALTNMAYPTAYDLAGITSWKDNRWDEVILMGNAAGGAITMNGLPTGYKLKIDGYAAVTESGGTATIPMTTWETYAFPSTIVYVLDAASVVVESLSTAVYGGASLTYTAPQSQGIRVDYQMTVYKPDDTTILTPQHPSAPHSEQFIVTTATDWSGDQCMQLPRGRSGSLDVLTGVTDTGAVTIELIDRKLGTSNSSRWVTAFVGNASNIADLVGLKVVIKQRIIDAVGITTADWFTGRIDNVKLSKKNELSFRIRDMADDLKYTIFTGLVLGESSAYAAKACPEMNSGEAAYVNYGSRPMLAPIGLMDRTGYLGGTSGYGGFVTQRWLKGEIGVDSAGGRYITIDRNYTPRELRLVTSAWPGVGDNPRTFGHGLIENPQLRIRVRRDADSTFGDFYFGERSVEASGDMSLWSTVLQQFFFKSNNYDEGELVVVPLRELNVNDGDYKAATDFSAGNLVYCHIYSVTDPSEATPIYIHDVHPVTLFKDILAGKWGLINIDGTARRPFPYDSTSFTALEADATIPKGRWIIEEPEKLNEWVEENICKPYLIGYRLNESGEVVVFRTTRPTSASLSGAPTIDSNMVLATSDSGWEQTKDDAVNLLVYKSYDEVGPTANVTASEGAFARAIQGILENAGMINPRHLTPVVQAENTITYLLAEDDNLKQRATKKHEVEFRGLHTGFHRWEANFFGVRIVYAERARAWADRHKETLKALFSWGPIYYSTTCRRTAATADLYPGEWALLQIPDQLDPANAARGGVRAGLCTERTDNGLTIDFKFLDGGPNSASTAPTLNALSAGTDAHHQVNVPINYGGFGAGSYRVVVEYAMTDTATGTRPVEGSSAWLYGLNWTDVAASGVVTKTLSRIPSNARCWVRARTEPSDTSKLPSAWVFPSGAGYIDTTAYTAPSSLSVDTASYGGGIVGVTLNIGETTLQTEVYLAQSTCPAGSYELIKRLDPGTKFWVLQGTEVSTTYCIGALHRDLFGGATAMTTQQFTTAASLNTAPVMADVAIVFSD